MNWISQQDTGVSVSSPAKIYSFKVNNRNTRKVRHALVLFKLKQNDVSVNFSSVLVSFLKDRK